MTIFDKPCKRDQWFEAKWSGFENGEIPMSVADMDFEAPAPIIEALKSRLEYPYFGYSRYSSTLAPVIAEHYRKTYDCTVENDWFCFVSSVMPGVNLACLIAGGTIMYCEPMYVHIRMVSEETHLPEIKVPMMKVDGRYTLDFDAMEKAITPEVTTFILCSPHNPVGTSWTWDELCRLADFCRRHDLLLISDEIHCEFTLDGKHIPLFTVPYEKTVTLSSAGKICNVPAVPMGFAIIPNEELRNKFKAECHKCGQGGNMMGAICLNTAYNGELVQWKEELREYLRGNRAYTEERIAKMPLVKTEHGAATYLSWIDCTDIKVDDPREFFHKKANVVLTDGESFGDKNFVRLNYACPRAQLQEALDSMEKALIERAAEL